MDIQIKCVIEKYTYTGELLKRDIANLDINNNCLFTIQETDYVFITLFFDNPEIVIELEDSFSGAMNNIKSNERTLLSDGRDDTKSYLPGYYSFHIIHNNQTYERVFLVKPNNVDFETVLDIRDYVNFFYSGLSTDILRKRHENEFVSNLSSNTIHNSFLFFLENMPQLINTINQYIEVKKSETEKKDEISNTSKKVGHKTVKWLAQKGMSINKNVYAPDTLLVRKTRFNLNHKTNQIFKSHLVFWNNELAKAIKNLQEYIYKLENETRTINSNIQSASIHLENINKDKKISEAVKKSTAGHIMDLRKDLNDKNNLKSIYEDYLQNLKHYKTFFEYTIFNTWVKDISSSYSVESYSSDYRISLMQSVRNEYYGIKQRTKENNRTKKIHFSEKSTSRLFETYLYILIISLLRSNGYEISDLDFDTDDIIYRLSNSGSVTLVKGEQKCTIFYDIPLKRSNSEFEKNEYTTVNSKHNRPDFILSYTDSNDNLIDTIILEAKWRPLRNIYSEKDDTDIVETLKDYYNLGYHDVKMRRTIRSVVSRVIVLYPDVEIKLTNIQNDEILAFGFLPVGPQSANEIIEALQDLVLVK